MGFANAEEQDTLLWMHARQLRKPKNREKRLFYWL